MPYLTVITPFLHRSRPLYPGSALLAISVLGGNVAYLFCDLDGASSADLQDWARRVGAARCQVARADGMTTTARWLDESGPERAVVHVDPFDPHARVEAGRSALDLAADVVDRGHVLVYWYGYDEPARAGWAYGALRELTGGDLWCGDAMVTDRSGAGTHGDLGAATTPGTGCGVVLGNVTSQTAAACTQLGHALAAGYHGATLPSGKPGGIQFTAYGSP